MPEEKRQQPAIGRIVHYVAADGTHQAAIITEVDAPGTPILSVGLAVFAPDGFTHSARGVLLDPAGRQPGTYHWPERVGPV